MKKAQSMSMNVIIVAVLALIVLVVLLYVFSSKMNIFGQGVSNCQGTCSSSPIPSDSSGYNVCQSDTFKDRGYTFNPSGSCPKDTKTQKYACCVQPLGKPPQ